MIDLSTGRMEFDGIVIEPNSSLDDFKKYSPEKVTIHENGKNNGFVRFNNPVKSNGVDARIKIDICDKIGQENIGLRQVTIFPLAERL